MLPMVGSLDDIRYAKSIIEEVKNDLSRDGIEYKPKVPLGIMIEIPSIAIIADTVAKEVDFASIGTNDLCQYLTAADRLNPTVSKYYQNYHPAMFKLIRQTVSAFRHADKPIGVCGEMGGDPAAAAALIGLGIRKLSMGISSVARIKKLITGITLAKAEEMAETIITCATADEISDYLNEEISKIL